MVTIFIVSLIYFKQSSCLLDAGSYNIMLNGVNVVGDIGSGDYQVTWSNRFVESEIWNSYSHPLPIISKCFHLINL